jgi:hypothetical protein
MSEIIKNAPIPPRGQAKPGGLCDLMRSMEVGDSMASPVERRSVLYVCAKHVGISIITRMVNGQLFFWRKE